MQAIILHATGGPEVMTLAVVPDPIPGPEEIIVRTEWAGLNYIDVYHRTGLYKQDLPFIPGLEGSGTVIEVGRDVNEGIVGSRVAWAHVIGSYAEKVKLPADRAVPVPNDIATDIGAATLTQGMTAHFLAVDTFQLERADRCLIHAAAGGVGRILVQIAKIIGAEVFATVGSNAKIDIAKSAGADHVINYNTHDFVEAISDLAGPRPLSVVYDGVGASTLARGLDLLKPRGLMVSYGNASGPPPPLDILALSRGGSLYITRPSLANYITDSSNLHQRARTLFEWISAGRLDIRIGARFSLNEAADAHRAIEGRGVSGKVLLHSE